VQKDKVGRNEMGEEEEEKHFLFPTQDMGVKTQNGGEYLWSYTF
jgi:hypothetical protein